MGTGKRRSKSQKVRDRRRIADLYLKGWLQVDIAEEVGLSSPTVSRDLKALQAEWLKSSLMDFDEAKAREIAKIDRLEREYWTGWQRSLKDEETIKEEGSATASKPSKVTKTRKGQAGDPRFLDGVLKCVDRRCKIIGVDAAVKVAVHGTFDPVEWKRKADERLEQLTEADEAEDA